MQFRGNELLFSHFSMILIYETILEGMVDEQNNIFLQLLEN